MQVWFNWFISHYILVIKSVWLHIQLPGLWINVYIMIIAETAYTSGVHSRFFCGIRVARSLVFCVVFCRSLFVLLSFFCHCVVSPSIEFWEPLWYLHTLLTHIVVCVYTMKTRSAIPPKSTGPNLISMFLWTTSSHIQIIEHSHKHKDHYICHWKSRSWFAVKT